jgi:hypothetical protein
MTSRDSRDDKGEGGAPRAGDGTWPVLESINDRGSPDELISPTKLMRYLDEAERAADGDEEGATSRLPRVTKMPEGIKVEEHRIGRAIAQWVLHVRCECGRRWFEVEAIDTTTCPRCGMFVYVDVDARSARSAHR